MIDVRDKRGGYQPLCRHCHDEGCPACEHVQAAALAHKLRQEAGRKLEEDAKQFIVANLEVDRNGQKVVTFPASPHELISYTMAAIEFGIQQERERRQPVAESVQTTDRFKNLEIEG